MKMSGKDLSRWQANARGVDLNHNYDAGFYEYKKLEEEKGIVAGATRYSGEHPFSEPETAYLSSFIRFTESLSMIMTFHSSSEEIYYSSGDACVVIDCDLQHPPRDLPHTEDLLIGT